MSNNPLGPGVSRYTDDRDKQLGAVVFQFNKPILDSELNLISLTELEAKAEEVRSRVASGWLMNDPNPRADYFTNPSYSNLFYFGRNTPGEIRNLSWAVVNGWLIPVAGTETGAPPLAADDTDTWNKILLNPAASSTGGNRADFVFLEVWLQVIDVDPAPPGIAPGKPQRGFIYRFGNVLGGFSFIPDDLIDPNLNFPTTKRVQIQYQIRVVPGINIAQYAEGFDPTTVFAQGLLPAPSSVPFTNMRQTLGDPGLWRAGTGDPTTFGTVDGYIYAIPLCSVFRRNSAGFSDTGNLAGAFNRNSVAILPTDATTYTAGLTLNVAAMALTDTTFQVTSIAGTVLATMNSFAGAYFKIDDEIIQVTNVVSVSPTLFTVSMTRGQLGTTVRTHAINTAVIEYTTRPDGLYADQVAGTDILDLRHSVADKFDYDAMLRTNLVELLKGNLRSTWKRYGSTQSAGPIVLYGDRITDSSVFVGGLTALDAPDGNRRMFSDSIITQRFNVPVTVPSNAAVLTNPLQFQVDPYNIEVVWTATPPIHTPGNRLSGGAYSSWWNGDQITIELAPFYAGFPASDANQVRFVLPTEDPDAVVIRFEGMITDPGGAIVAASPGPTTTSPTVTVPSLTVPIAGNRILKQGQGINVALDINGNLVITLQSGAVDTELQEFRDALQGNITQSYADEVVMHIDFAVVYGSGRGLSHKPDYIHTVQYQGDATNTSETLLRSGGLSGSNRMIPTYLGDSPYVQTGVNRNLARTSEVMIDTGSKSVYVAPYRVVPCQPLLARNGSILNWYYTPALAYQGAMPLLSQNGSSNVYPVSPGVDPLNLFYHGTQTIYFEIPWEYLPRQGQHYIPIQATTGTVFPSGVNFLFLSQEGVVSNTSQYNPSIVSYPNAPGYYIVTAMVGETYGANSGPISIFGQKYTNNLLTSASGGPFQGIQFPPYLAPARITGVYQRGANGGTPTEVVPVLSPFDNSRTYVGLAGSDVNLLHDNFDGPTILLDVDDNGDVIFVLNADAINMNLSTIPGSTFANSFFLVECTLFAYDRGFLQTNGRVLNTKTSGGGSVPVARDTFTTPSDGFTGLITPAPLESSASNNQLTIYYSRQPYQGDPFGTQNAYSDDFYRLGPLTVGEAEAIAANPLGPVDTLILPNQSGFEILSSLSFVSSLGTGRLSGLQTLPILNTTEAPNNPPDYPETLVDLQRRFAINNVGYEDWADPLFPVSPSSLTSRPVTILDAIDEVYDNYVPPEFAGSVTQLPLGIYFRDKDFIGKTLYLTKNSSGVAINSVGTFSFIEYEASLATSVAGSSTWEGTEFVVGNTSGTAGVGTESVIRVDGTASFTDQTIFKTTRGGAAYSATGPWPGGVISSRFPKARPNIQAGSVLAATAYLVRSQPETSGSSEIHMGSELQMVIVTQAVPSYFKDTNVSHSASGTNEGFTAVDRYRLLGKPLEKRRGFVDLTIVPSGQPIFNNNIYDNPLYYGSSDVSLNAQKQETLPVTVDGQTVFTLSQRPLDPTAVMMWLNGVKMRYGVDYTVGGVSNQTVTFNPSPSNLNPDTPGLLTTDTCEFWYLLF